MPERVFVWIISVATVGALWTWATILIAHLGHRKAVVEGRAQPSPFRMPGSPVTNWIALAFIVLVACFLAMDPNTRVALYVGPLWFAILALGIGSPSLASRRWHDCMRSGAAVGRSANSKRERRHHAYPHL